MEKTLKKDKSKKVVTPLERDAGNKTVFAIHNNQCIVMKVRTDIEHRLLLRNKYGVSPEEYNTLIRGYINPGEVVFYMNAGFKAINDIPEDTLNLVMSKAAEIFGNGQYRLYNCNIGKLEALA